MPYIPRKERIRLDTHIDQLLGELWSLSCHHDKVEDQNSPEFYQETGARLNYILCELLTRAYSIDTDPRYYKMERVSGTLLNVALEIYRRVGSPYEDVAMDRRDGGDTSSFRRFTNWLTERLTKAKKDETPKKDTKRKA